MALNDSYQLSLSPVFLGRVQAALITACVAIANEGWSVAFHRERQIFCAQILAATSNQTSYAQLFANTVSTDANVLADATAGSTAITVNNRDTQAALVTDAHINTALASQFNSFIREPA